MLKAFLKEHNRHAPPHSIRAEYNCDYIARDGDKGMTFTRTQKELSNFKIAEPRGGRREKGACKNRYEGLKICPARGVESSKDFRKKTPHGER